ncbi:MAG: hypothetical protein ACPKQO_09300 [Nitrososphaeraceae archaeon]
MLVTPITPLQLYKINSSGRISKIAREYVNAKKDWLAAIHLPKNALYLNPKERKVN